LIVYLISAIAPHDVLLRLARFNVAISPNMTTMGWRVKVRFFYLHSGSVFFRCAYHHCWWKSSRPSIESFDSRKTFVLSCRSFYRYRRIDALCFANRTPAETIRLASCTLVGSYSNYLKVLHRSGVRARARTHTHTHIFFHCSTVINAYQCILLLSVARSYKILFVQNFIRFIQNFIPKQPLSKQLENK